jgi:hypothetical protein
MHYILAEYQTGGHVNLGSLPEQCMHRDSTRLLLSVQQASMLLRTLSLAIFQQPLVPEVKSCFSVE